MTTHKNTNFGQKHTYNVQKESLTNIPNHFFFYSNRQFLPLCENACSHRERRVPQHGEQMARPSRDGRLVERRRGEKRDTHTEIRQNTAHTVPMRAIEGVCVYVWWVVPLLCVLVKAVCMLWCVWWGELSSAGHHTNIHTGLCRAASLGGGGCCAFPALISV